MYRAKTIRKATGKGKEPNEKGKGYSWGSQHRSSKSNIFFFILTHIIYQAVLGKLLGITVNTFII